VGLGTNPFSLLATRKRVTRKSKRQGGDDNLAKRVMRNYRGILGE